VRSKALAFGFWLLSFAAAALAQQQVAFDVLRAHPGTIESVPWTLHHQVAEVAVHLAVTDRSGKPVTELRPDDLRVLDDGIPAAITALRRDDNLPLRVALVVDWSDSMRKDFAYQRRVALDFLQAVLQPETDRAAVVGFRYRVELTQALTGNVQELEAGLRPVAGVPLSSVYDALIAACDELRNADPSLPQRRAIVLLSDGEDNVSAHRLPDVVRAAQQANITIYTIDSRRRRSRSAGQALAELAQATGGRTFFISPSRQPQAFAAIQQDLRLGYAVYFKPGALGGERYRPLDITGRDRNMRVSAPRSYYAGWE
jgi:VWFA-related protein